MSFYRKYRPQVLSEIDNSAVRKTVESLLTKKKEELPHAYLLTGPRGTGKTTTARILAKVFNCQKPSKTGEPCGQCHMCTTIGNGSAIDVFEIDAASNTGVDNIRDLKDKIMLAPSIAKWKIYIIDEVHMLSTGAFNALLKTLEEPPQHTAFVLATTEAHKVPTTIQSRCLILQFQRPKLEELISRLTKITKEEQMNVGNDVLEKIAIAGEGSFRDAIKLLEQASLLGSTITIEQVNEIINTTQDAHLVNMLQSLQTKNAAGAIKIIEEIQKDGGDIRGFYTQIIRLIQKKLIQSVLGEQVNQWNTTELKSCLHALHARYIESQRTNFPELPLQLGILDYCQKTSVTPAPIQQIQPKNVPPQPPPAPPAQTHQPHAILSEAGPLSKAKLETHWGDLVAELKSINHSIAGILRSARPKQVENGIVTIEAFYTFHKDKLSEIKTKEALGSAIKKLFGEPVTVEIVLGKK